MNTRKLGETIGERRLSRASGKNGLSRRTIQRSHTTLSNWIATSNGVTGCSGYSTVMSERPSLPPKPARTKDM